MRPSNSTYLSSAAALVGQIVNMSENSVCHAQLPQPQSSTSEDTVWKHRRTLDDLLRAQKLQTTTLALLKFDKPDSSRSDNRKLGQHCIVAVSTNYKSHGFAESDVLVSNTIGPVPLIKTSQMLGCDAETGSMSAGLRTEQKLALSLWLFFTSWKCSTKTFKHFGLFHLSIFTLPARKGIPCHVEILKSYPRGLGLTEGDSFVCVDALPNRLACRKKHTES